MSAPPGAGRMPDFFVVGHQKCGTTALHLMLGAHPQVFLPRVKEPRYFAFDLRSASGQPPRSRPRTLDGYLALFAEATDEQRAGEVSPQYLRSRVAAAEIARARPDAKIVAILREPAAFLRSLHMQLVASGVESEGDFGRALQLEAERREGRRIPRGCMHPDALLYSQHVRYAEQLRRFGEHFAPEQMLVLIYERFRADNQATLRQVLRFIGVDENVELQPVRTGTQREVRSPSLHRLAWSVRRARRRPDQASPAARALARLAPAALRVEGLQTGWRQVAYRPAREPREQLMHELRRRFRGEVRSAGELLGIDLISEWGYSEID